jgi:type IV pilus assembly protein PilX
MKQFDRLLQCRQRGISLVIVMIFLVILSVLGITAMQGSTLSSRIARNEADRNLAFQAALRDCVLTTLPVCPAAQVAVRSVSIGAITL